MLPFFGPKAVERFREPTRGTVVARLVRGFIEDGRVDAADDYARRSPRG